MEIPRHPTDCDERYDIDTNEDGSLTAGTVTGARSAAYMDGRAAFGAGLVLDAALLSVMGGRTEAELNDFALGHKEAAELAATEPGFVRPVEPTVAPALPSEIANETHLRNHIDIAEREFTAEQLTAARQAHREWMRNHGQGDPMQAAALRLPTTPKVKDRALLLHAAVAVRDEGREGREQVPSMDAPAGDPGAHVKGKRKKKGAAAGPQKSKRSTSFVSRIGGTVVGFRPAVSVDDTRLLEMLRAGGFSRLPEQIMSTPEYGFCPIDDPSIGTGELTSLPTIGSDPEWMIFGLRRDAKTGCPTHRFRFEAEHQATQEALAAGKQHAPAAKLKELQEMKVAEWYRKATPQTTVFPCTWHRPTWTLYVHTDNAEAVMAASGRAGRTLGALTRLPSLIDGATPGEVRRTDLRSEDVAGSGTADLGADVNLWLVGGQLGGTGVVQLGDDGGKLEWWLEDAVDLERSTADDRKLRVRLAGAPAEGGSLAAGLADGATLKSARLALRVDEMTFKVTLSGGIGRGWTLPTTTKPDGTPAGLDAAIDERLRLWQRGTALLDVLLTAALGDRFDKGTWRQRMSALRVQLGMEMVKRWGFDANTKQGFLFSHMLPGEQMTLGAVTVTDGRDGEATKPPKATSRGRGARDAAAGVEA